ncbi:adenylosuccinate lyase [Confluentibacter flavum]|uniref:Adenylosuccinate lyase n=1 Tax=Confluentibacter flavum TaxID=1909700 RepID=A0A2N3HN82_9FLAO|nr:adenylosuccinate lyase [Confluentibacter flavum]PKQ46318.1 adenylosuccinate lyase [Confluentibacter flavum]
MTKEEFYNELTKISALRDSRLNCAQLVKNDMKLFPYLIEILFNVDDKKSCHAAWVFEFVCEDYIYALIPHLDTFTKNIHKVHLESAIRPVSKVCQFMAKAYYSKENNTFKRLLSPEHKERIVETCFDWMINKHKVATKVFAMETLFLFGQNNAWIHTDLKHILEQDFQTQSAAYKSRAKHILHRMKKNT